MSVSPEQLAEIKAMLSEEAHEAIAAIREEVIKTRTLLEVHSERVDKMEMLITEHHMACSKQKEDISEMLDLIRTMKAGMRISNFMQSSFVKLAGVVTACYGLWQIVKDHFK
jgi:hypothetical protein